MKTKQKQPQSLTVTNSMTGVPDAGTREELYDLLSDHPMFSAEMLVKARRLVRENDHNLLAQIFNKEADAFEVFVDRFLGLILHVVEFVGNERDVIISDEEKTGLCADVFSALIKEDFSVLRRVRKSVSVATFVVVAARRIVLKKLQLSRRLTRSEPVERTKFKLSELEELLRLEKSIAKSPRMISLESTGVPIGVRTRVKERVCS